MPIILDHSFGMYTAYWFTGYLFYQPDLRNDEYLQKAGIQNDLSLTEDLLGS